MEWSKYNTIEKWKIIKSMVVHNNIFSMALHIQDLELFKKILSIDGKLVIQALTMDSLIYHDIIGNGKYDSFFEALYNYLNDSKPTIMPLVSNKKEYYPIFEEVCNESLKENISSIMIYLEKESDDHPKWEYEDTLEYYLKTRKNYDQSKPEPEIERREDGSNLNYAELDLEYYKASLDYYLEPVGVG
ncbi:MAG: hypothetical protein RLZZ81_178 [Pseudomonadota bacterium]|jgi:hypothetical protein